MTFVLDDGITYSFGVFYDEFLTYFDEGKGATAWILSILVGMTLCSGKQIFRLILNLHGYAFRYANLKVDIKVFIIKNFPN